mmetsp:Transcript_99703/g.259926  ORF Transcript_99703/g.259926 Transcript_99703/m.259926 type:complete len:268 (+) Transcript_99703:1118-1921(+)
MRLPTKPSQLPTMTAFLPMSFPIAMPVASVRSLECLVRMFSSSCITLAGEKKWQPITREGSFSTEAMSSMLRPLVLVHMKASGRMCFSMSRNTCFLRSMISGTASITMSTSEKSSYLSVGLMRSINFLNLSSEILPLFAWAPQSPWIFLSPSLNHSSLASFSTTGTPFSAKHMAMPPPISPAPRMPTFLMGAGLAVRPGTFWAARSAKKRCCSAFDCRPNMSSVNCSASTLSPSLKLYLLEHAARKHSTMALGATIPGAALSAMTSA